MTRAEFVKIITRYLEEYDFLEGEDLISYASRVERQGTYHTSFTESLKAIADIATNGFDPEPTNEPRVVLTGQAAQSFAQRMLEEGIESAKRSRPFVGSHKLPWDSDWDG